MRQLWIHRAAAFVAVVLLSGGFGCRTPQYEPHPLPSAFHAPAAGTVAVFYTPADAAWRVYGAAELAERRFIPCSTFKIVSTLMGLDAGVVAGPDARLGYDGARYDIAAWNADVTLQEAFQASCVWYYKKLIGRLDKAYVQKTLDRLAYGNCDLSVWNSNGHNVFWIESSLLISPREQVEVLAKLFSGQSGFRPGDLAILKACMAAGSAGDRAVYGKTGTGRNHITNHLEAWFVGFAEEANGETTYFAMHVADPQRDIVSADVREMVREMLSTLPRTGAN